MQDDRNHEDGKITAMTWVNSVNQEIVLVEPAESLSTNKVSLISHLKQKKYN